MLASELSTQMTSLVSPKSKRLPPSAAAYELQELIGHGTCATVYRAWCPSTREEVAVKVINLEWFNQPLEQIRREIHVMNASSHPNVVPLSAAFVREADLWMVMPLLIGGSVRSLLDSSFVKGMPEDFAVYILWSVLKALRYFHKGGQIHRDVKAANLLLDSKGVVLLSDYGMMAWMDDNQDPECNERVNFFGTPCWMAPEVMEQATGYDCKADIWSLGITAIELAQGVAPYFHEPPLKIFLLTLEGPPPTISHSKGIFSSLYKDFIASCLQKDPNMRPSAAQLLRHRLFAGGARKPPGIVEAVEQLSRANSFQKGPSQVHFRGHKIAGPKGSGDEDISNGLQWDFSDGPELQMPVPSGEDKARSMVKPSDNSIQTSSRKRTSSDFGTNQARRGGLLFSRPPGVHRSPVIRRARSDGTRI